MRLKDGIFFTSKDEEDSIHGTFLLCVFKFTCCWRKLGFGLIMIALSCSFLHEGHLLRFMYRYCSWLQVKCEEFASSILLRAGIMDRSFA